MNRWLALSALIEAATGLALVAVPAVVVRLLLGAELSGAGVPLGRVAGIALLGLGLACWPGGRSDAARPAFRALLGYNVLVALYLGWLGLAERTAGPLLWPAVAVHAVVALLLIVVSGRARPGSESLW